MKETVEAKQPLKNSKAAFKLVKNDNWESLPRKPKKRIRAVTDKDLPPTAA